MFKESISTGIGFEQKDKLTFVNCPGDTNNTKMTAMMRVTVVVHMSAELGTVRIETTKQQDVDITLDSAEWAKTLMNKMGKQQHAYTREDQKIRECSMETLMALYDGRKQVK
jgi:hypothetical protein